MENEYEGWTKTQIMADKMGTFALNVVLWSIAVGAVIFFIMNISSGFLIGIEQAYTSLMNLFS